MAGLRQFVGLRISDDPEAVPTTDDIAEGELAFNVASERIYARFGSTVRDITDRYTRDEIDAMLGTAAALDAPGEGDASAEQVVLGSDSRLSDARTPTAHTHTLSDITDAGTAAAASVDDFEPTGSVQELRDEIGRRPDALLLHFL